MKSLDRVCLLITCLLSTTAFAIQPGQWHHRSEADFQKGTTDNVVVTNLGEIKLAANVRESINLSRFGDIVFDMERLKSTKRNAPFGAVLAMGPAGTLVKVQFQQKPAAQEIVKLKEEQIFALTSTKTGQILVGVSSEKKSRIAVLHEKELLTICELEDVRYIWDLAIHQDKLYIATGKEGQLFEVNLNWDNNNLIAPKKILDLTQANLTKVAVNAKTGQVYVGTDQEGLIYRLDQEKNGDWRPYILYDAAGAEISAMHLNSAGDLYFATAAAGESTTGRLTPVMPIEPGKPDESDKKKESDKSAKESDNKSGPNDKKAEGTKAEVKAKDEGAEKSETKAAPAQPKPATTEQRDKLREIIRTRLAHHRKEADASQQKKTNNNGRATASAGKSKKGNAIYRIDAEGYVSEVFRESVLVLDMLSHGNSLWAATGDEAELYQINFENDEVITLADLDPKQISAMTAYRKNVYLASSNPAQLFVIERAFTHAPKGEYVSEALDANQISLWGTARLWASTPKGASISLSTRSGNVKDPEKGAWSKWSKPKKIEHDAARPDLSPAHLRIDSPPARFIQYKITFTAEKQATESPALSSIRIKHVSPNLPPQLAAIVATNTSGKSKGNEQSKTVNPTELPPPPALKNNLMIQWKGTDPNNDRLIYELSYRRHGESTWHSLKENLMDSRFLWHTTQVPDGMYFVRVSASDRADNTPSTALVDKRVSSPITVDKESPEFSEIEIKKSDKGIHASFKVTDQWSEIKEVRYGVPGEKNWHLILPQDLIFDSTSENMKVNIPGLSPDLESITLRASDVLGNTAYRILPLNK